MKKLKLTLLSSATIIAGATIAATISCSFTEVNPELDKINLENNQLLYDGNQIDKTKTIWDYRDKTKYSLPEALTTQNGKKIKVNIKEITNDKFNKMSIKFNLESETGEVSSDKTIDLDNFAVKEAFIIDPDLQMNKNAKNIEIKNLSRAEIQNTNSNLLTKNNAPFLVGGYGEDRNIYADSPTKKWH